MKQQYPHLKVSRPVEDICQYCYAFCNRHRYLANHSLFGVCSDGNEDEEELLINLEFDKTNAVDDGGAVNDVTGVSESAEDQPDFSANSVAEDCEQLLLESAEHIKMARVQRALYQEKVAAAVTERVFSVHYYINTVQVLFTPRRCCTPRMWHRGE